VRPAWAGEALRLSNARGSVSFADSEKVSTWAKEAVADAIAHNNCIKEAILFSINQENYV